MSNDQAQTDPAVAALDFADAALGAAGHQVTDPRARELAAEIARGSTTPEAALQEMVDRLAAENQAR